MKRTAKKTVQNRFEITAMLGFAMSLFITHPAFAQAAINSNAQYTAAYQSFEKGDYQAAISSWDKLAKSGNGESAYALGVMYDNGYGLPRDPVMALSWYEYGAMLGNKEAADQVRVRTPSVSMSSSQVNYAQDNGAGVGQPVRQLPPVTGSAVVADAGAGYYAEGYDTANPSVFVNNQFAEQGVPIMAQNPPEFGAGAKATPLTESNSKFVVGNGFYVGANAGVFLPRDNDGTFARGDVETNYSTGFQVAGTVGYRFSDFRTELELGYSRASVDNIEIAGVETSSDGTLSSINLLANAFYDIPVSKTIVPYIGGGIGVGYSQKDIDAINFDESKAAFLFNGEVGVSIGLMDTGLQLVPSYRYIGILNEEGDIDSDYGHVVRLGLRYPLSFAKL